MEADRSRSVAPRRSRVALCCVPAGQSQRNSWKLSRATASLRHLDCMFERERRHSMPIVRAVNVGRPGRITVTSAVETTKEDTMAKNVEPQDQQDELEE